MEWTFVLIAVAAILFSFSVFLNLLLIVLKEGLAWYSFNSFTSIQSMEQELVEANSQLLVNDSINDIIDYILELQEVLFEVSELEVYTGEPIIQELVNTVNGTLSKIQNSVVSQEYARALDEIDEQ